jgi:hypothetical protein
MPRSSFVERRPRRSDVLVERQGAALATPLTLSANPVQIVPILAGYADLERLPLGVVPKRARRKGSSEVVPGSGMALARPRQSSLSGRLGTRALR